MKTKTKPQVAEEAIPLPSKRTRKRRDLSATGSKYEPQIQFVMSLMRKLEFRRGETSKELEKKWGLEPSKIKRICAEASHRVCDEVANPTEVERDVGVALSEGIRLARERKDWKTMGDLCRILSNIHLARPGHKEEKPTKSMANPSMAQAAVREMFGDKIVVSQEDTEKTDSVDK